MKAIASLAALTLFSACGSSTPASETPTSSKPRRTQVSSNEPAQSWRNEEHPSHGNEWEDAGRPPQTTANNATNNERPPQTAQDQSDSESDLRITQNVRQAVIGNDALSMTAKNVTNITRARVVTLRGRVLTAAESTSIETNARDTAGVTRVENTLEVRP